MYLVLKVLSHDWVKQSGLFHSVVLKIMLVKFRHASLQNRCAKEDMSTKQAQGTLDTCLEWWCFALLNTETGSDSQTSGSSRPMGPCVGLGKFLKLSVCGGRATLHMSPPNYTHAFLFNRSTNSDN